MNSFGLGLVLNFSDNASSGMNNATANFNKMSATADSLTSSISASATEITAVAYSLGSVGNTFTSVGESIVGVFANVTSQVINTGNTMQGYRMQMTALYGSAEAGAAKLEEISEYARTSVFDMQSLIPAVTTMKAVGIEAMDEITTSSGGATQKLLDYASDLAAMMPNMKNAYGTGVSAAMGAFKEYIAEGNAMSLKRGAGLDITQILGEEKGSTIEERTQQVADLIETLGVVGYTASLAGTPMQRLSNLQDVLFNSMSKIADSGVYEVYCDLLETLSNWVTTLVEDEETFNTITGVLADTISTLLSPLKAVLNWVIENSNAIIGWVKENPKLTKTILVVVAAIGGLLIAGGTLLKLLSTMAFAMSGLSMLKTLPSMISSVGSSFGLLALKMLPVIAIAALMYNIWSKNLFGIRDVVTKTFGKLASTISLAMDAFKDNTLSAENFEKARQMGILPFIEGLLDLKYRFGFFVQGFKEGWNQVSETVAGAMSSIASSLSGTVFQPIIDKVSEFFGKLSGSDTQGWHSFGASFAKIAAVVSGAVVGISSVISVVSKLLPIGKLLTSGIKTIFGLVASNPVIAIIIAVVAGLVVLYNKSEAFRNTVQNLFSQLGTVFSDVFGALLDIIPQLIPFIQQIVTFLGEVISRVVELVGALLPAIMSIVSSIINTVVALLPIVMDLLESVFGILSEVIFPLILDLIDMLIPFITSVMDILAQLIDTVLVVLVDIINSLMPVITGIIDMLIPMLNNIIDALLPIIDSIMALATSLMEKMMPIIEQLLAAVVEIIDCILEVAMPIIEVIMTVVGAIMEVLMPVIELIIEVIGYIIDLLMPIIQVVTAVITTIVSLITDLVDFLMPIINGIVEVIKFSVDVVVGIITTIVDIVTAVFTTISGFISSVWQGVANIFTGFIDIVRGVFTTIYDIVTGIFQGIADFFSDVWDGIVSVFTTIGDTISGAVRGAINGVLSGAVWIINGFIKAINFAIGAINLIPGVEIPKLDLLEVPELATGGVVNKPTNAIIGEAGAEAVVPLENNLGWIENLAHTMVPMLHKAGLTPANHTKAAKSEDYLSNAPVPLNTSTKSSDNTNSGVTHVDNRVTFETGSIVIQLSDTSDAELERVAEKLMKMIARKQQLRAMAVRT